jgi:hypothetical protein
MVHIWLGECGAQAMPFTAAWWPTSSATGIDGTLRARLNIYIYIYTYVYVYINYVLSINIYLCIHIYVFTAAWWPTSSATGIDSTLMMMIFFYSKKITTRGCHKI